MRIDELIRFHEGHASRMLTNENIKAFQLTADALRLLKDVMEYMTANSVTTPEDDFVGRYITLFTEAG